MSLSYHISHSDNIDTVYFSGPIDEDSEVLLSELPDKVGAKCVFNFKAVTAINSLGVRAWINFLRRFEQEREIFFAECPPELVSQINMIPNFRGSATIVSVYAGYVCDNCDHQMLKLFRSETELAAVLTDGVPEVVCPNCGKRMEMEELEEEFFAWIDS